MGNCHTPLMLVVRAYLAGYGIQNVEQQNCVRFCVGREKANGGNVGSGIFILNICF